MVQNEEVVESKIRKAQEGAHLTGKIGREIAVRPRDGQECNCSGNCFGVCDLKWNGNPIFNKRMDIVPTGNGNTHRLYFIDELENTESEFGVDADLIIPNGTGTPTQVLLKGMYDYNSQVVTYINANGEEITSYGYVDVQVTEL